MTVNERILSIVKAKGPILPAHVSKEINDSLLVTSARLSEMFSNKLIMISNIKVGGSPLYYVAGQEDKLQNYVDNLPLAEKKAYNLLKENKILRESAQEPVIRVALRQIKDFSIPLQVVFDNNEETFWKWYLTDNKEVEALIKNIISRKEITENIQKLESPQAATVQAQLEVPLKHETELQKPFAKETEKTITKEKTEVKKEIKKEITKKPKKTDDNFSNKVNTFFNKNKIDVLETREIKNNIELDFIIELQTSIGNARYFCKVKNKAKINESDLSTALLNAQSKGLPLLFLSNGEISKKAKEMLGNELRNIIYKEI